MYDSMNETNPEDELEEYYSEVDNEPSPPKDIVAFNESRSCADVWRMVKDGALEISLDYQRELVWPNSAQTRFIDSLIKQYPIPSLCFGYDYVSQKWQVIDGLQRISTILRFFTEPDWVLTKLSDIDESISGQPVSKFLTSKKLQDKRKIVENLTLPITVIRCDFSKRQHQEYLFNIFHRLNTGGVKLNNQEIRNCIYSGEFNSLLRSLNCDGQWLDVASSRSVRKKRYQGEELILRFFALYDDIGLYSGKLVSFLNEYMSKNRNPSTDWIQEKRDIFKRTVAVVHRMQDGRDAHFSLFSSNALLEAVLVGVASNIDELEQELSGALFKRFSKVRQAEEFSTVSLSEGLARKDKVLARIAISRNAFGSSYAE